MKKINIYTDGSSLDNPGRGGYGVIIEVPDGSYRKELTQGYKKTTNNRMELLSVIVALESVDVVLKSTKMEDPQITVYSDSTYVVDSITRGWLFNWEKIEFKGRKNADLWVRFLKIYSKRRVNFQWIKGHNEHPQNERCDEMARWAANQKGRLLPDRRYEELIKNQKRRQGLIEYRKSRLL